MSLYSNHLLWLLCCSIKAAHTFSVGELCNLPGLLYPEFQELSFQSEELKEKRLILKPFCAFPCAGEFPEYYRYRQTLVVPINTPQSMFILRGLVHKQ